MSAVPSRRDRWTLTTTLALFALPPLVDLLLGGTRRVVSYCAADTFYYLTVARNVVNLGFPTFDHVHATNGFHPLWQLILSALYGLMRALGASDEHVLTAQALVSLAFLALALALVGRAFIHARGSLTPWFALAPIGVVGLVLAPLWLEVGDGLADMNPFEGSVPVWGTLWFAINGMETAALVLAWAAFLFVFVCRDVLGSVRWGAVLGLLAALVVLARLDHAPFALLPLAVLALTRTEGTPRIGRPIVACAVAAAIPVALYLAWNIVLFGSAVPISGSLKSSFPHPTLSNFRNLTELLATPAPGWWLERAGRSLLCLVPMLVSLVAQRWVLVPALRALRHDREARLDAFLRATSWAVVVLGSYDFLFVSWPAQGHWYFPVSTLFCSLVAVRALMRRRDGVRWHDDDLRHGLALLASSVLGLAFFWTLHRHPDHHARYADFLLEHAPAVRAAIGSERPRVVEFDDGIIAWGTGFPSIPASGLTLDPVGARRVHDEGVYPIAVEREHLYFTSSVVDVGITLQGLARGWPDGTTTVVYRARDGFFGVVRLDPRTPPAPTP